MLQTSATEPRHECVQPVAPHATIPNVTVRATKASYLKHFSDLCYEEIKLKQEKKSKESENKESKNKKLAVAQQAASAATQKSEVLSKKLKKAFDEANELRGKIADNKKEADEKVAAKTKEATEKLQAASDEKQQKVTEAANKKDLTLEKNSKSVAEQLYKKKHLDDEMRVKIYDGWKQHLAKVDQMRKANITATIAEERKCKAEESELVMKHQVREAARKKAAASQAAHAAEYEKTIKESAMKTAQESVSKGQVTAEQATKEKQRKTSVESAEKQAQAQEKSGKEGNKKAAKKAAQKATAKAPSPTPTPAPKVVEETRTKRVKETVQKMKTLRAALTNANEMYNKTSHNNAEKKAKCAETVTKSKEKVTKTKESAAKSTESEAKEQKIKKYEAEKEKNAKAVVAANPYNHAEKISKSVLDMKSLFEKEKEKEAKAVDAVRAHDQKKYEVLQNEASSKERTFKHTINTLNATLQNKMEVHEKAQCMESFRQSEKNNKLEEHFWNGRVNDLKAQITKVHTFDEDEKRHAVMQVCEAAADDLESSMQTKSSTVFKSQYAKAGSSTGQSMVIQEVTVNAPAAAIQTSLQSGSGMSDQEVAPSSVSTAQAPVAATDTAAENEEDTSMSEEVPQAEEVPQVQEVAQPEESEEDADTSEDVADPNDMQERQEQLEAQAAAQLDPSPPAEELGTDSEAFMKPKAVSDVSDGSPNDDESELEMPVDNDPADFYY